jgi:hypothetical protein
MSYVFNAGRSKPLVAAILCFGAVPSDAATFKYEALLDGLGIEIHGKVDTGDGDKFVAYYNDLAAKTAKSLLWINLDSSGGNVGDALKIAAIVEKTGATTRVQGGTCSSACFYIWAAGRRRLADSNSRLGVHTAVILMRGSAPEVLKQERDTTVKLAGLLRQLHVPDKIVREMQTTPWPVVHWLTKAEVAQAILTEPVAPLLRIFPLPPPPVRSGSFTPPADPFIPRAGP